MQHATHGHDQARYVVPAPAAVSPQPAGRQEGSEKVGGIAGWVILFLALFVVSQVDGTAKNFPERLHPVRIRNSFVQTDGILATPYFTPLSRPGFFGK